MHSCTCSLTAELRLWQKQNGCKPCVCCLQCSTLISTSVQSKTSHTKTFCCTRALACHLRRSRNECSCTSPGTNIAVSSSVVLMVPKFGNVDALNWRAGRLKGIKIASWHSTLQQRHGARVAWTTISCRRMSCMLSWKAWLSLRLYIVILSHLIPQSLPMCLVVHGYTLLM